MIEDYQKIKVVEDYGWCDNWRFLRVEYRANLIDAIQNFHKARHALDRFSVIHAWPFNEEVELMNDLSRLEPAMQGIAERLEEIKLRAMEAEKNET